MDITEKNITERAQSGISYAFQQPVRFKGIEVFDLLRLASGKQLTITDACQYLSEVGLCAKDYIKREVNDSLSGGELKRIEIATVLARGTKLSIFDEPEAGIDLWSFQNLIAVFERMRHNIKNGSILIISHRREFWILQTRSWSLQTVRSACRARRMISFLIFWGQLPQWMPVRSSTTRRRHDMAKMDEIQKRLLEEVADLHDVPEGI